tara:strand:+ start:926 stop:1699 length:774 start_codon:yes stop_codon:yes gene_type:complete
MKTTNSKLEAINYMIAKSGLKYSEIARSANISRPQIHRWINKEVADVRFDSVYAIADALGYAVKHHNNQIEITNQNLEGDTIMNMSTNKLIDLYDENRDLRIKVDQLQSDLHNKQAESTHWDALEYDFISDVTLLRNGWKFGRVVNSITDIKKQSEVLGYSVDYLTELWNVGKRYKKIQDHPIDAIISHETSKSITTQLKTLPALFDTILKSMVGDHYIPQPIIYNHKDGHKIGAVAFCKVQWSNYNIVAKVQFLTE